MTPRSAPEQLDFWPLDAEPRTPLLPFQAAAARWFCLPPTLCRLWLAEQPCPRHGPTPLASPHGRSAATASAAPCWYEAGRQIGLEPERFRRPLRSPRRLLPHEMDEDEADGSDARDERCAHVRALMRARYPKLYEETEEDADEETKRIDT